MFSGSSESRSHCRGLCWTDTGEPWMAIRGWGYENPTPAHGLFLLRCYLKRERPEGNYSKKTEEEAVRLLTPQESLRESVVLNFIHGRY